MKNLIKIILPIALTFSNVQNIQNSEDSTLSLNDCLKQKEIAFQRKKEFYENTIKKILPKTDSMVYMWDIHRWGVKEFWQTPRETDSLMSGDCEDRAIFAYDYLTKKGLDIYLCWGRARPSHKSLHFWNEYKIGDTIYILETTSKSGSKIINSDTLDRSERYKIFVLGYHTLNTIKDFEDYSGIKLNFTNPKLPR